MGSLNHSYRLVWNELCGAFVAVPEFARGRGKRTGGEYEQRHQHAFGHPLHEDGRIGEQ